MYFGWNCHNEKRPPYFFQLVCVSLESPNFGYYDGRFYQNNDNIMGIRGPFWPKQALISQMKYHGNFGHSACQSKNFRSQSLAK